VGTVAIDPRRCPKLLTNSLLVVRGDENVEGTDGSSDGGMEMLGLGGMGSIVAVAEVFRTPWEAKWSAT
jgi:hypothetical protein